jgi:Carboxypeptidase regulatory-like domain
MNKSTLFKIASFTVLFVVLQVFSVHTVGAQVATADVVGTVTDSSGAVLPGATVTITNLGTGAVESTTTGGTGDYAFTVLQVGTYSVKVEAKGFKTYSAASISLSSGDRARVDAKLEVGEATQTVEVSGAVAPALQTDTATQGTLVTTQAVENIPLNGRNVTGLIQLAQGVTQGLPDDVMSGNRPDDRRQSVAYSANGQNDAWNNNTVDGMDNNDYIISTTLIRPSIDAIQEVNVSTNLYDASVTRSAGAVVDIITKSGTNDFHGSAYEFFRNKVLNANPNYVFPAACPGGSTPCTLSTVILGTAVAKPPFRQNQYGASLGGPIRKNKTFFFADIEKLNRALGLPITSTVPTLCERGLAQCPDGLTQPYDFSDIPPITAPYPNNGETCSIGPPGANQIQYGTSGCPYVVLNPSLIPPLALDYFKMYPLPTNPGLTNNYTGDFPDTQNSTTWDVRIDERLSDSNTFFARYSFDDVTTVTPGGFPIVKINGVSVNPGAEATNGINNYPGTSKERAQALVLSWAHVISPNLVLNLKAGFDRLADNSLSVNATTDDATKLGFPCNSVSCVDLPGQLTASGIPVIQLSPAQWTSVGDATWMPIIYYDTTFQYNGTLSWNKGSHNIRIGAVLLRRRATQGQSPEANGGWNFTGGYTGEPGGDLLYGLAAGGFPGMALRQFTTVQPEYRIWEPGVFFQDDWRARHWLTLNLGMRYDIFTNPTEKLGRQTNWNPANGYMMGPDLPGIQQSSETGGIDTFYGQIAPRIGFAATLKNNTVIRGGFGISYFTPNYRQLSNPPYSFNVNCEAQNAQGSNTPCQAPFAQSATVMYGAPGPSSQVGFSGGPSLPAGIPVPSIDITQVLPPASCPPGSNGGSVGCSLAGGNQYAGIGISGDWPHFPSSDILQFNLQVQKELGSNVVEIGYVGELGRHNQFGSFPMSTINSTVESNTLAAEGLASPLAAIYPWLNYDSISPQVYNQTSSFNALEAGFVRRFQNGLTANVNYTWAHALASGNAACQPVYSPGYFGYGGPRYVLPCYFDNPANPSSPIISTDSLSDGPGGVTNTAWGTPNHIAGTVDYELPFGKTATGIRSVLTKGWTANLDGYWQSGFAFGITNGAPIAGNNIIDGGLDQTCSGRLAHPTKLQWINPSCWSQPTISTYGNADGGQEFGPRQRNVDFSFFKTFDLTERFHLQFRTEVFNILNMPDFANPGGEPGQGLVTVSIPYFTTTCTSGQGTCGAGSAAPPGSTSLPEGAITSLNTNQPPREIQFALKLLF